MVDLNKDHMDELYSKIHDERQCVTSKSLCIDLGITRRNASQLLEAVLTSFNQDAECVYEVTRCVWKRTDGKSGGFPKNCLSGILPFLDDRIIQFLSFLFLTAIF